MTDNVISYMEMCSREGASLQRGMNFRLGGKHSVILMSVRNNAPYQDRLEEDGTVLIYEGHDQPKTAATPIPKKLNQIGLLPSGKLTQNGKFFNAAVDFRNNHIEPERVRVYEKIRDGIWSYNGIFLLVDSWLENDGSRQVYKFKLVAVNEIEVSTKFGHKVEIERRRLIPTNIKLEVWKRDAGRCTKCGATDELHFDHILPFAKGGTSLKAENVQLLCARHNLQKRDRIE